MLSVLGAAGRTEPCCVHGGFPRTQPCLKSRKVCTVFHHTWISLTAANTPDLTGASLSPPASCGGGNVPSLPSLGLGAPTFSAHLFQVAPQCPSACFYSISSEKAALSPCKPAHSANCQPGVSGVFFITTERTVHGVLTASLLAKAWSSPPGVPSWVSCVSLPCGHGATGTLALR